jgi:hypothetical protein
MTILRALVRTAAVVTTAAVAALGGVAPAQAASTTVSGTVNCTGTRAYYSTVRYMSQPSRTELYLTKAAGGTRSGYGMAIGMTVVATGRMHEAYFVSANRWGTIQSGNGYVANTRFTMNAKMMSPSSGACSNTWSGDLSY